ncbi:helix-turn-helix domain-containing protein [Lysinibacillus sp. NPDC093190]|uniref:helix-turn-helix domain-containing protein n=1 Tax=Lysinibacillus sp. NPDC093190 TaxID=3390575 RepID=UPI003CFF3790
MNNSFTRNIGQLIKHQRKKQKIKQDDLAIGVCTSSYLSRIENGLVIADEAIYQLLLQRLNIDLHQHTEDQEQLNEQLEVIWEKIIRHRPLTSKECQKIITYPKTDYIDEIQLKYAIVHCRYLLFENKMVEAEKFLEKIKPFIQWESNRITQMYILTISNYYLLTEQYTELINMYHQFDVKHYSKNGRSFEHAYCLYNLAFAYNRVYQNQKALNYIEAASNVFSHYYAPLFQLNLYLMKAVIFNSLYQFEKAFKEYEASLDLIEHVANLQTPNQMSSIYNNLGYCYECQELFEQAIVNYEKSLTFECQSLTVVNYIRTLYRHKNFRKMEEMIERYKDLSFQKKHEEYQFEVLSFISNGKIEQLPLKVLEEKALCYFEQQKYYSLILFYAPLFAELYKTLLAYKQASNCYERAFVASERVRIIMS